MRLFSLATTLIVASLVASTALAAQSNIDKVMGSAVVGSNQHYGWYRSSRRSQRHGL